MLAILFVLIYIIVIVAVFIVFIKILQLLEGELYNQKCMEEQKGNREALTDQTPDVFVRRP
jgi:flagellar biosynthesis/type III secretory pathway M-ring protein FliF/YscJ